MSIQRSRKKERGSNTVVRKAKVLVTKEPLHDLARRLPGLPRGLVEECTGQPVDRRVGWRPATWAGSFGTTGQAGRASSPLMLQCRDDRFALSGFPLLAVTGGAEAEAWSSKGPVVRLRQNLDHNLRRAQHIRVSTMPRFGIEEP